jgi:hypothetical protein
VLNVVSPDLLDRGLELVGLVTEKLVETDLVASTEQRERLVVDPAGSLPDSWRA